MDKVIQTIQTNAIYELMFASANGNFQKASNAWEPRENWYIRSKPT